MTETPSLNDDNGAPQAKQTRLAWIVLLGSFVGFCALCLIAGLGLRYFFFESTVTIGGVLTVGRGTAGVTGTDLIEQVVREARVLSPNSTITTDSLSQATLSFFDPYDDAQLIAAVTILSNTAVDLRQASRPRFEWSGQPYEIELSAFAGSLFVSVPPGVDRPVVVTTGTNAGDWTVLTGEGQYDLNANPQQLRVVNEGTSAVMVAGDSLASQAVGNGQRGLYYPASDQFLLLPGFTDLLGQGALYASVLPTTPPAEGQAAWACYNGPYDDPVGSYSLASEQGRRTVRLYRGGGAQSHGDTGCALTFTGAGQDVSQYAYLSIQSTFQIANQSLSACGVEGSECPMMLRIDYVPSSGQPAVSWYHGFFALIDPGYNYPLICASCTREHDYVNQGAWFTYQSDNLFAMIPPNLRPASILNVRFYASGHEYDVFVNDLSLFAGAEDPPVPEASAAVFAPDSAG